MRGESGEGGPRRLPVKRAAGKARGRAQRRNPESRCGNGVARNAQRPEDERLDLRPVGDERLHKSCVTGGIDTQIVRRCRDGALDEYRGAVVERMSHGRVRMNPRESVLGQRQPGEKRRKQRHGMHCGADVVYETWQCLFGGARASANRLLPLQHEHGEGLLGESNGGGQTVGSGTDNYGVILASGEGAQGVPARD